VVGVITAKPNTASNGLTAFFGDLHPVALFEFRQHGEVLVHAAVIVDVDPSAVATDTMITERVARGFGAVTVRTQFLSDVMVATQRIAVFDDVVRVIEPESKSIFASDLDAVVRFVCFDC
jgi:hypothetical protein